MPGFRAFELLRTLEARGAFISLNGQFLFLTSAVDTKSQQQAEAGCWFDIGPDPVSPARISAALPAAWQVAVAGDHALVCDYTNS